MTITILFLMRYWLIISNLIKLAIPKFEVVMTLCCELKTLL